MRAISSRAREHIRRSAHQSHLQTFRAGAAALVAPASSRGFGLHSGSISHGSRSFFSFSKQDDTTQEPLTASDVYATCRDIHDSLLTPLNNGLLGPLEKSSDQGTPKPLVLVMGNHSSGKSTFINYMAGRTVQETGVAPTDDGFTVIVPGNQDSEQDGPAMVGDPDLGFGGLRSFGTSLINHVYLKVRTGLAFNDIMLVDTPGMIDAPISTGGGVHGSDYYESIATNASPRDRGYNFPGVMRWYAERADVILLFFDPDKPGTTGETLAIMTNSLVGLDHKLHIVLNKVDQFKNVHDFARAYGSLCWNLSKVIPRKDLPRIYTMCVPTRHNADASNAPVLSSAMADLESTRKEIVREVKRAPLRRVDNVITRLYNSSRLLSMHATVLEAARSKYAAKKRLWFGAAGTAAAASAAVAAAAGAGGMVELAAAAAGAGLLVSGGTAWYGSQQLAAHVKALTDGDARGLDELWRTSYFMALAERDDFVVSLWEQVRPRLLESLRTFGLHRVPKVSAGDLAALQQTWEVTVPELRRAASKVSSFHSDAAEVEQQQVAALDEAATKNAAAR